MLERLSRLPDFLVSTLLRRAESDANELKAVRQPNADLGFVTIPCGSPWTWSGTLPAGGQFVGAGSKLLRITATSKHMSNLVAEPILYLYEGTSDHWWHKSDTLTDTYFLEADWYVESVNIGEQSSRRWVVLINGDEGRAVWLAAYLVASDDADVTIEELN